MKWTCWPASLLSEANWWRSSRLEAVAQIILYQEKRFDGSGIPIDSIAGEAIPLGARVIKVLYDLIRTRDGGISRVQALQEMANRTGWYDPQVLKAAAKFFDINFETATFQKPAVQSATLRSWLRDTCCRLTSRFKTAR